MYLFSINALSKQKLSIHHGVSKPRELMLRRYAAHMVKLSQHLVVFPGSNHNNKNVETEINDIILHSIPNGWGK